MRVSKIIALLAIVAIMGSFQIAMAGKDGGTSIKAAEKTNLQTNDKTTDKPVCNKMAVFAVADLDKVMLIKISKFMNDQPGVESAKPNFEKKELTFIFDPSKTNEKYLTNQLGTVAKDVKLLKVGDAPKSASKAGCGKCPSKSTCGKAKTTDSKTKKMVKTDAVKMEKSESSGTTDKITK